MASQRPTETAITWSGLPYMTLSNNSAWVLSDAVVFGVEDWEAEVCLLADNAGTPASGDTVEWRVLYCCGSVDGSPGDDYVNAENGEFLTLMDTYGASAGGGVVIASASLRTAPKAFKLAARGAQSASRNIDCRAIVRVHQPQ